MSGHGATNSSIFLADYFPINVIEESPQGVHVPSEGEVTLFLGAINARTAATITWIEDIRAIDTLEAFFDRLREQEGRKLKLGLVGEALLPVKYYRRMRSALDQSEFVPADDLLNRMRAVGHGVGINVVEWPNLDADSEFLLEPGMALAIKYDLRGFDKSRQDS